ncbi:hypothetical protein AAHC03_01321 [Spirometra sp. Aus1]
MSGQMIAWMAKPPTNVPCPPGLEYLLSLDKLVVKQKKEMLEIFTGFETANKYVVLNAFGQQVFYAMESSSVMARLFLGPSREFEMKLVDYSGTEVLNVYRPFKCCAQCCLCCPCNASCLDEIEVKCPTSGTLGYIRQQRNGCQTLYCVQDVSDTTLLQILGPSLCCNVSCVGNDLSYQVLTADGNHTIGIISKKWTGFLQEYLTDADTYAVTFPVDLQVTAKALLMAAAFLIDFMFFENNQRSRQ